MRLAELNVYYKDPGVSQIEGFIPTQIRRIRPNENACEILVCDDCYGSDVAPWVELDMSYKHARYEIDRALSEHSDTDTDTDTDTDPRTQVGSGANPCPQCGGAPQANYHPVPPDKVRAIMTCPACNPESLTQPGRFFWSIGRGINTDAAVADALEKWNRITRAPGLPDENLDRR